MVDEHKDEFARFRAPFRNAEITLIDKPSEDISMMELRIREGRRITTVELDQETVGNLARAMQSWAQKTGNEGS